MHTVVLWSKDFSNLLTNGHGLKDLLAAYDQIYLHVTVTGLGGTDIEPGVPPCREALAQLPALTELAGSPLRVSVRFDPILHWREEGILRSNLSFFSEVTEAAAAQGIRDMRMSFAQWYGKAVRRAGTRGFAFFSPSDEEQRSLALELSAVAAANGLILHAVASRFSPASPDSGRPPASTGRSSNRSIRDASRLHGARTAASAPPASARSRKTSAVTRRLVRTAAFIATPIAGSPHAMLFDRVRGTAASIVTRIRST